MLIRCCNPECQAPFKNREGRLIRFSTKPASGNHSTNNATIEHYWLCKKCAEIYTFDYESASGGKIKPRKAEYAKELSRSASAA